MQKLCQQLPCEYIMCLTLTPLSTGRQTTPRVHSSLCFCTKTTRFIFPTGGNNVLYSTIVKFNSKYKYFYLTLRVVSEARGSAVSLNSFFQCSLATCFALPFLFSLTYLTSLICGCSRQLKSPVYVTCPAPGHSLTKLASGW